MIDLNVNPNILDDYTKIVVPNTTTMVGINVNKKQILFDVGSFNTTIKFNVELEPAYKNNNKVELVNEALHSHCYNCKIYALRNTDYELDEQSLSNLICDIRELKELYEELEYIADNISNLGLVHQLLDSVNQLLKLIFPCNVLLCITNIDINYLIRDITCYSYNVTNTYLNNSLIFYNSISLEILNICGRIDHTTYNTKKIIINTDDFLLYTKLNKILELELYREYDTFSTYRFILPDLVKYFTSKIIKIVKRIGYNHNLVNKSIKVKQLCQGIGNILDIEDCRSYYLNYHNVEYLPDQLIEAFYAEDEIDEGYTIVKDEINLKIIPHYYLFDYYLLENYNPRISIFRTIELSTNKQYLELYPFNFPNVSSSGNICFDENMDDIAENMKEGKFSNILEVFWSSFFNHDLALNNGFDSSYNTYTFEYHDFLKEELINKYPIDKEIAHYTFITNDIISSTLIKWCWYDTTKYNIYFKLIDLELSILVLDIKNASYTLYSFGNLLF